MKTAKALTVVGLCGVLCALTACSSGSSFVRPGYDFNSVGKVAVIVDMSAGSVAQQQEVADLFAMQVLKKGYDVIDRANLADLAKEAAFQSASGITSVEGRQKLAIHNVSAVIVVNVSTPGSYEVPPRQVQIWVRGHWMQTYDGGWVWEPGHYVIQEQPGYVAQNGEEISMTAKMLDVKSGMLLWSGEGTGSLKSGLATFSGALLGAGAGAVAGGLIGRGATGAVVGGVAGALGGGAVGSALEEDMAQLMRSVIEKTCRGLPMQTQAGPRLSSSESLAPVAVPAPAAPEAPVAAPAAAVTTAAATGPAAAGAPAVAPMPAPAAEQLAWPRSIQEGTATLTMYEPKIQKWTNDQISAMAAVSIQASDPVYGVASLTAAAELNKDAGTATFSDFQVSKVSFPTAPDKAAQYFDGFRKLAPAGATTIPLDKLETSFALSTDVKAALGLATANAAARILFTTTPTILVLVDGQPALKPMAGMDAERVVNTRSLILKTGGQFYLTALNFWYQAPAIEGPWAAVNNPPALLAQARDAAVATKMVDLMQMEPGAPQPTTPPAVRVSTVPMDLIQTDGPPQLFPVAGGALLQIKNTDDVIFLNLKDSRYYAPIANQWFASKSLYGPWAPVAAQDLPADLAKMPASALTPVHAAASPEQTPAAQPATQPPVAAVAPPYEPPPAPVEVVPPAPGPDYYWSDGYWDWGPAGWFWIGGRWTIGVGPGLYIGPGRPWGGWGHGRRWR